MSKIALQAHNGQYFCAEEGGGREMIADRDWIRSWETFELIDLGNNKVALRANNGQYVCAEGGGGREVVANRDQIRSWETFEFIDLGNNRLALRAHNGQYVCAEGGGGREVMANRDQIRSWETLGLVDLESDRITRIGLAANNGQYVCAEGGGGREVVANRDQIRSWETFELIDLGGNRLALRAHNGQYVCAEGGGGREVVANRDQIRSWETFELIDLGNNRLALRAHNGQYVCAEGGGGREVVTNRDRVRSWETFSRVNVVISGLYREQTAAPVEEFRLDVDGNTPQATASGKVIFNSSSIVWWIAGLSANGTDSWKGQIWYTHGARNMFRYTEVQVLVTRQPTLRAQVVFSGGGVQNRVRQFDYRTPYFHDVEFEYDCAEGIAAITSVDTHAHPTRPTSLPAEKLSIKKVYERAGFRVTKSTDADIVPIKLAGSNKLWSDMEMHDAMQLYWSRFADRPQWTMWVFFAATHEQGHSLGGIMFDDIGPNHRQGTAIFNESFISDAPDADPEPEAWIQRMRFWTACHEMGHAFNLAHSWQKALGNRWKIGLSNEPEARSFMNYPYNVKGGQEAFFRTFAYRFSDQELEFMRHAPAQFVQMGNADWFDNHGFQQTHPDVLQVFQLELRVNRKQPMFQFLEPIVLELKLKNISALPKAIPVNMLSELDHMVAIVKKNGRPARRFLPYAQSCYEPSSRTLGPGESIYESLFISAGQNGWDLAEPGNYLIQIALHSHDEEQDIISNPLQLRIAPPHGYDEELLAQDFFSEDVGRILTFNGSQILTAANDTLREVAERLGERKVALHAKLTLANKMSLDYKLIDFDKREVNVIPSNVDEAHKAIEDALIDNQDEAVETLGHIDYKNYMDRFSDWLVEQGNANEGVKVQHNLREILSDRKVATPVLETIKKRIDGYTQTKG
jgi:carbamate kinase